MKVYETEGPRKGPLPDLEPSRETWARIAKNNGWYREPFFVQVWADPETNKIYDSVSTSILTEDVIVFMTQEEWDFEDED